MVVRLSGIQENLLPDWRRREDGGRNPETRPERGPQVASVLRAAACPSTRAAGKAATPRLSAHVMGMSTACQLHREFGGVSAKTGRR